MTSGTGTSAASAPFFRAVGGLAIVSAIIAAVGVVFLIAMFVNFAAGRMEQGQVFGMINDICVALQYALTIPVAIALQRILMPHNARLIRIATAWGIAAMLVIVVLQLLLVFGVLTFAQQGVWASLAILLGVGGWLVATGLVARSTGRFPNSVVLSAVAVPYFGFPAWAYWLGRILLAW